MTSRTHSTRSGRVSLISKTATQHVVTHLSKLLATFAPSASVAGFLPTLTSASLHSIRMELRPSHAAGSILAVAQPADGRCNSKIMTRTLMSPKRADPNQNHQILPLRLVLESQILLLQQTRIRLCRQLIVLSCQSVLRYKCNGAESR